MNADADDKLEAANNSAGVAQRGGQELALAVDVDHGIADVVQRHLRRCGGGATVVFTTKQ